MSICMLEYVLIVSYNVKEEHVVLDVNAGPDINV